MCGCLCTVLLAGHVLGADSWCAAACHDLSTLEVTAMVRMYEFHTAIQPLWVDNFGKSARVLRLESCWSKPHLAKLP